MYFKNKEFVSKNKLYFWWKNYEWGATAPYENRVWFTVGTIFGMYIHDNEFYDIWTIINKQPGNGHLDDVLEWFELFCERENKDLLITRIENMKFRDHLISKRAFIEHGPGGVRKIFKKL